MVGCDNGEYKLEFPWTGLAKSFIPASPFFETCARYTSNDSASSQNGSREERALVLLPQERKPRTYHTVSPSRQEQMASWTHYYCNSQHLYYPVHIYSPSSPSGRYHARLDVFWRFQDASISSSSISVSSRNEFLIWQQNKIGWGQLFQGQLSTEWSWLQGDHYYCTRAERPGQNHKFTGDGWQVCIITLLWKHWRVLLKQRNGHDAAASARAEKRIVIRQLEQIYNTRSHMEPSVQSLLHQNIH